MFTIACYFSVLLAVLVKIISEDSKDLLPTQCVGMCSTHAYVVSKLIKQVNCITYLRGTKKKVIKTYNSKC